MRSAALLLMWLVSVSIEAGVVERVVKAQDLVVVKLSKAEKKSLRRGQSVSFAGNGTTVVGKVESIKGSKALIKVDFGVESVAAGQRVRFAGVKAKKNSKDKMSKGKLSGETATDMPSAGPRVPVNLRDQREFLALFDSPYGPFISPAQSYQASRPQVFVKAGQYRPDWRRKTGSAKESVTGDINSINFSGLYVFEKIGLRLGLMVWQRKFNLKGKDPSGTTKVKLEESVRAPFVSYAINPTLIAGMQLNMIESSEKIDSADRKSLSYNRSDFAIIKLFGKNEIGFVYLPPIDVKETGISEQSPQTSLVHYDWYLAADMRFNGFLSHQQDQMFDESPAEINGMTFNLGMDFDNREGGFWGLHIDYRTRTFVHHPEKSFGSIASYALIYNQKIIVDPQSAVMFLAQYTHASDDIKEKFLDDTSIKRNDGALQVQYRYDF